MTQDAQPQNAQQTAEYPGTLNPMAEEMIRLGRDPRSAESYIRITDDMAGLSRASMLKDRQIEQIKGGLAYFATLPAKQQNGESDALTAKLEELTANEPCYRPPSARTTGKIEKPEGYKARSGVLGSVQGI